MEEVMTVFAPAERLGLDKVLNQHGELMSFSSVCGTLDSLQEMVFILNRERQIVFINRTSKFFLGKHGVDDSLGLRLGEAVQCCRSDVSPGGCGTSEYCVMCGAIRAILASQTGVEDVQECRVLLKNSHALDLLVKASPFKTNQDSYSLLCIVDISNEKRRRVLEKTFFHDLLNAVGGLSGYISLMTEVDPGNAHEYKEIVARISEAITEEIRAQQQLTAAENNELRVTPVETNSLEFLKEVLESHRGTDIAKGKKLGFRGKIANVTFTTDRILLRRVLGNMIKNALEASETGDSVRVSCKVSCGGLDFSVYNSKSIPREVQLQVFNRSFSTKGLGRGLGTYGMKLLGERYLKGKVSFFCTPDEGTVFSFWCPMEL